MKFPLVYLTFLRRSLFFPILLFSSVSLHWSLRKTFLSLLTILWNSAFIWVYLSFSPLPLASLLFSDICKASSDNHFAFLHFFFLEMFLITASSTMSRISVHSSSGTLSNLLPWIYLSVPLYHPKGFDLAHTWIGEGNGNPLQYSCLENPMDEGACRLRSMGSLRVRHDWATSLSLFTFTHWRRKWQTTPVFLPGESQGRGSLVGCRLRGCTESDTTKAT